ncbi:hypothetical protein ACWGLG_20585 [Streptomyces antimycoticus]
MPQRSTSPDALQRQSIRDLVTGLALKLSASADIDLDGLEVLAKLLDAQAGPGGERSPEPVPRQQAPA